MMCTATAPRCERTKLQLRLGDTIHAINDLARMLEAVRYQSGLGKSQWQRVERARKVAAEAGELLAALASRQTKETTDV
jgi:hypothetical protein